MTSVLIIDDDPHIRCLLHAVLEALGHQIVEASNGKEALDALESTSPSLVITDIHMPEMDGIEMIRHIRCIHPDMKIIAISGEFSIEDVNALDVAHRLGATETLQKPFEIQVLRDMVQGSLSTASISSR